MDQIVYPIKLSGRIGWFGGPDDDVLGPTIVKRAFRRDQGRIVIDCECQKTKYDVSLTSKDGIAFKGHFVGILGSKKYPVEAEAQLYSNSKGCLLFGRWVEDNGEFSWWAELEPVEKFVDEDV